MDCLRGAGFFPCLMEPDIWITKVDSNGLPYYEHVTVCVDDLLIASKTPEAIFSLLQNKHKFKLKDTCAIK